jgi:membrane protein implicated in regulation of membrane protease activity
MTWTQIYLVCFLLGFSLSAVSWLLGMMGLVHLPHLHAHGVHTHGAHLAHGHGPHAAGAHGAHAPDSAHAHADSGPGFFNFSTATAFLAWFGGAGYLMTRYSSVWPLAAMLVSAVVGVAGAAVVFVFMAKVLYSPNENLNPDDYDVVGQLGKVSVPIRAGGTGEILFTQAGSRRVAGARSEDGAAIEKGIEVVITRYHNGLAYVKTWSDMSQM